MNINDINPYIRVAMRSMLPAAYTIKTRIIMDYELVYVESGSFTLIYDNTEHRITQGTFLLIRPGISHSFLMGDEPLYQPHIHFDLSYATDSESVHVSFKDIHELTKAELKMLREDAFSAYGREPRINVKNKERFLQLFYSIVSSPISEEGLVKKAMLTELISMIVADNYPNALAQPLEYPIERQLKDYIDEGQCFDMSLDDIARRFSYDKFYLEKRFGQAYGMGIVAYRNERRLEYARQMLGSHGVGETAKKTGFTSIYAFSRAFKKHYGYSPSKITKSRC